MITEEDLVNYIGQEDYELLICIALQYPEHCDDVGKYIVRKYFELIKVEVIKDILHG